MNEEIRNLIEKKWLELTENDKEKLREIFSKLNPIDEEYYIIKWKHDEKALYYIERYCVSIKFEGKIEEIFCKKIYDIDAKKTLNAWCTAKIGDNYIKRFVRKKIIANLQKLVIHNRERITKDNIEYYLKLIIACRERQDKVLSLHSSVPDKIVKYVSTKGEKDFKEMEKRYDIFEWQLKKICQGFEHGEEWFWYRVAIYFTVIWGENGRKELNNIIQWRNK